MYYDTNTEQIMQDNELILRNLPSDKSLLKKFGVYNIIELGMPTKQYIQYDPILKPVFDSISDVYFVDKTGVDYTVSELLINLAGVKRLAQSVFSSAFTEIDAKLPRNARGIILSLVDGTFPKEDATDLTPEQQQRIVDVGIMWELEEVAQVNRDMQTELLALEITEDMTLEEAQEITLRIANAKPWLPWRE